MEVVVEVEPAADARIGPFAIDAPVDGEGGMTTVERKHFGGPAGGCEQHHFLPECHHRSHNGPGKRSLSRAGRPAQNHHRLRMAVGEKTGKDRDSRILFGREGKGKLPEYLVS